MKTKQQLKYKVYEEYLKIEHKASKDYEKIVDKALKDYWKKCKEIDGQNEN